MGFRKRKLTFDERVTDLVDFAAVMLRKPIGAKDAACLIDNWGRFGPDALHNRFDSEGGKTMPRKTPKAIRTKAAKAKPARKPDKSKPAPKGRGY